MYDIAFISYKEPNADKNWENLTSRFPWAKRISRVRGIHMAHIAAASKCFTNMFWVVDGDAEVLESFDFSFTTKETKDEGEFVDIEPYLVCEVVNEKEKAFKEYVDGSEKLRIPLRWISNRRKRWES